MLICFCCQLYIHYFPICDETSAHPKLDARQFLRRMKTHGQNVDMKTGATAVMFPYDILLSISDCDKKTPLTVISNIHKAAGGAEFHLTK